MSKKSNQRLGFNPFSTSTTRELNPGQQIICTRWVAGGHLQFYLGRVREVSIIVGLEREYIARTIFSAAILRENGLVECWGDYGTAQAGANVVSESLGIELISRAILATEVRELIDKLKARVVTDKFKDDGGEFDTVEVTKRPEARSLDDESTYAERYAGKPHIRKVVEFDVPKSNENVRMEITKNGGFKFLAYTPQSVIDYVFQKLNEVKGN